jgi:amidase
VMIKTAQALGLNDQATRPSGLFLPVDVWSLADESVVTEMTAHILHLQEIYGPITPIRLSDEGLSHWRETFQTCQAAEIWACHENWITQTNPSFGVGIKERFESASLIDQEHANQAKQTRLHIQQKLNDLLSGGKVIIMPTSPAPAPKCNASNDHLNDFRTRALEMLCIAGLGGLPQMNIPAGIVEGGPVGLSLIGAKGSDETLLSMASEIKEKYL